MRRRLFFPAFVLLLCMVFPARAHRVNVFAWPEGDAIRVDCGFSRSQKVRHGALVFTDGVTGEVLLETLTDEMGAYSFRPSAAFLATGHGLHIRLNAGEGHSNDWEVTPEELRALGPGGGEGAGGSSAVEANGTRMWAPPTPAKGLGTRQDLSALDPTIGGRQDPVEAAGGGGPIGSSGAVGPNVVPASAASLSPQAIAELERVVARAVDARLAPVTAALARQQDSAPGLRDIIGGIGWILGLLGLATYMKYRR